MPAYIARRLLAMVPILFGLSILVFILCRIAPGNIAQIKAGPNGTPEQIAMYEHMYGLDKPMPAQYLTWLRDASHLDFGTSLLRDRPINDEIASRLPVTLQILIMTLGVSTLIGLTIGIVSAMNRGRLIDSLLRGVSILGMSVPTFWVATLVILLPSIYWSYAPPFSHVGFFQNPWDNMREYGPPALILGFASGCGLGRIVRGSILGVVGQDFMRTARAKGLSEVAVVRRHALGNVMLPIITILGMEALGLLAGAVIVEQVFNLNGLGRFTLESALSRDYTAIQAMALIIGAAVMLMFLLRDLTYAWLDPRVRLTGESHG
jgi:peptide/nickel transport system permease protein